MLIIPRRSIVAWVAACAAACATTGAAAASGEAAYGIASRVAPKPYLNMPERADGKIPVLLSRTGAFADTRRLTRAAGLIPYDIVVAFWSDGAQKQRWVSIPKGKIRYSPTGDWVFPKGTVFVKTFELPTDASNPGVRRRLETRLLVCDGAGGAYGVVYKWRADLSDADLLPDERVEPFRVKSAGGEVHEQPWYYPSRKDCMTCHNSNTSGVLGVKARQMNRKYTYPSGVTDNEIRAWNHLGLFSTDVRDAGLASLPTLAAADDPSRSLEDRARSYLDANCSHCHRPHGTVAYFDARYDTPPDKQGIVDGAVLLDEGIDKPRVISPHDIWRSIMYTRVSTNDEIRMPPIARETVDTKGVALLREWIDSLPGRDVLDPPVIAPAGGTFAAPVSVTLSERVPGADIHYTLDGSVPGQSDPRYQGPIKLEGTSVLRARAYKPGMTRSITTQQVFTISK